MSECEDFSSTVYLVIYRLNKNESQSNSHMTNLYTIFCPKIKRLTEFFKWQHLSDFGLLISDIHMIIGYYMQSFQLKNGNFFKNKKSKLFF